MLRTLLYEVRFSTVTIFFEFTFIIFIRIITSDEIAIGLFGVALIVLPSS